MEPLGQANITIMKDKKEHCLEFQVVKGNNKPLLSAQTCQQLGLLKITIGNETLQDVHQIQERKTLNKWLTKDELLNTYKDVFKGLGHIGQAKITVNSEAQPVQQAPRRIAITLPQEVKNKLLELEQKSIVVKETEPTDWISSMVVVAKPGKIRLFLDPKDLNNAVKRPKYQMPTLEEMLPKLNNAKVFSTLDAKDGFYQISLDEESSKLTTFWTPFGRYRYLRMPFGISSAPEEFEAKLHERLGGIDGVEILHDDILVVGYGNTVEDATANHDQNLLNLLKRAREVKLNSKKFKLRKKEVKFI